MKSQHRLLKNRLKWMLLLFAALIGARALWSNRPPDSEPPSRAIAMVRALYAGRNFPAQDQDIPDQTSGTASGSIVTLQQALVIQEEIAAKEQDRDQIDLLASDNDSLVAESLVTELKETSLLLETDDEIQQLDITTLGSTPVLLSAFESLDVDDCCGGTGVTVPPDPELAVGREHLIAAVNVAFEIYNRQGIRLIGPVTFGSLFNGIPGCPPSNSPLFDPNVLYDEAADRFILGIDGGGSNYCVAVAASSDPTGSWIRYRIPTTSSGGYYDYPQAGVGRDAIYLGGNIFYCAGCPFRDARVWAVDKWAMYAGNSAAYRERVLPTIEDTPQPAVLHGYLQGTWPASGPHYFLTETSFNGATYSVYAWQSPFGTNSLVKKGTFNLSSATGVTAGFPIDVPQPTGNKIMANDWRLQDAEYRNGFLWTTDTIACNPGGGATNCVRWAQINPANASVVQAGVVGSSGVHRVFADIAVNHCDDAAIGYTRVTPSNVSTGYPGIWVAGRAYEQPPNTLGPEFAVRLSATPYQSFETPPYRWGDYTGFTSDPVNELDIWYIGQYSKPLGNPYSRWGTVIGRFTFPHDPPPSVPTPPGLNNHVFVPYIETLESFSPC